MSVSPARTASSTTYWIEGLSTTGNISFGRLFVAGRKRVPSPAAGMTALRTFWVLLMGTPNLCSSDVQPRGCVGARQRRLDPRRWTPTAGGQGGADGRERGLI